ncbi:NAD(P)-binding protein [Stipitochalara longipes BDJ]|nr:NAD(P)-binding protein [Stipitochalara longipes BDJ]
MAPITSRYVSSHISPKGPGDARPTATQVIQDEELMDKWAGKTVLVTGANDTTGLETARALHLTGARTFLTTRSAEKGAVAVQSIIDSNGGEKAGVEAITMELSDLSSVRNAAREFMSRSKSLNILVCNAGVLAQNFDRTKDNFEMSFGVNHVGHFALFQELKQYLIDSSTDSFNSRVVMVASIGHRMSEIYFDDLNFDHRAWDAISAYGQSKTANIYMANYIDRTYGKQGVHAWSLQPGGINSNLLRRTEEEKQVIFGNPAVLPWIKTPEQGAATSVWAAAARDLEGKGGRYLESMQEIGEWQGPEERRVDWTDPGYASHAYDKEKEDKLWVLSEKLIG